MSCRIEEKDRGKKGSHWSEKRDRWKGDWTLMARKRDRWEGLVSPWYLTNSLSHSMKHN